MKNSWFRTVIKIWIVLTSAVAFVAGWIMLGHSNKPVTAAASQSGSGAQVAPLPTLAPLGNNNFSLQPLQSSPSSAFAPRMRTRGS